MPEKKLGSDKLRRGYVKKVWVAAGIVLLISVLFLLFKALFSLLLLSLAGILIAIYFHGFAGILERKLHFTPKLSLFVSVIFNVLLIIGFFWFVGARLEQQVAELSDKLPATIQQAKEQMTRSAIGQKAMDYLNATGNSNKTMEVARRFFSSGFGILSDIYIVILLALFFTASPSLYKKGIVHLLPPIAKEKGDALLEKLNVALRKWIKGQIIGFFFIAVFTGIGLWIIGMPLILTLALMAGILNLVPNFGPIIALVPAGLLALMQGPTTAIIVVCMYTFVQIIQSAVMQPLIQKKMVNIPPALTIIGQVALGMLGGFWGVLLAVPIVVIIMTLVNDLYVAQQSEHKYAIGEKD